MTGVLVTLGARDLLTVDGAACVAARAGLAAGDVVRVERLAERALTTGGSAAWASPLCGSGDVVVGCSRPRAVRALLDLAGVAYRAARIVWLALPFDRGALQTDYGVPWYPVIDRTRCTGCGTCAEYCLFSVYTQGAATSSGERVSVTKPLNCKTGCPACARLCPEGAVIFPFCHEAELNGEVEEPAHRSADALAALLGDDPMRLLAERRKQKRLIDPAQFDQAEQDRMLYSGVL